MDKGITGVNDCKPTEDSTPVKLEESLGEDIMFTDEEIHYFFTVVKEEDESTRVDWPSKTMFRDLTPFAREQIEEKVAYVAFRSLAPGLPIIPPERFVEVLEFRGAQKLCTSYELGSKERWTILKAKLLAKRKEILTAYREKLRSDMRMRPQSGWMPKRKASEDSSREIKRQQVTSAGSEGSAAPVAHPVNIWEGRKPVFSAPKPGSPRTPALIPEDPNRNLRIWNERPVFSKERKDTTEAKGAEAKTWAEARYPTPPEDERRSSASRDMPDGHLDSSFVTLRRKKAPREAGKPFVERLGEPLHRDEGIPDSRPVEGPALSQPVYASQEPEESHGLVMPRQIINEDDYQPSRLSQDQTCGYVRNYPVFVPPSPVKARSMDAENYQSRSRSPSGSPHFRRSSAGEGMGRKSGLYGFRLRNRSFEELDRKATDAHNHPQLVHDLDYYSDEVEPYDYYESEEDEEASPEGYSADLEDEDDIVWAPVVDHTAITLRKLAKMRDEAIKRKEALAQGKEEQIVQPQNQQHDLTTSSDSDDSLDGCLHRSPPGTRLLRAFTFRGYRFEMSVSGGLARGIREGQVRRGRADYWTVRENPESPTPVRRAPPSSDLDRFLLDSDSEGEFVYPTIYPSDCTDDLDTDEVTVDMELTVPLPSNINIS